MRKKEFHIYTPVQRESIRNILITYAENDSQITGAALTGSAALGKEDPWSDIDFALCLSAEASEPEMVSHWTHIMYQDFHAVHHLDVFHGETRYRVFLLENTLQVDISFWRPDIFGPIAPTFKLLFGTATPQPQKTNHPQEEIIGMAWLYALHARSSIARNRLWQAEYMISALRDQILMLSCLRYGVVAVQGRGLDDLPAECLVQYSETLVSSMERTVLYRAFERLTAILLEEIQQITPTLYEKLRGTLQELVNSSIRDEKLEDEPYS